MRRGAAATRRGAALAALTVALVSCSCALDPAEREYMEALRGEETGMGREAQIAHLDQAIALQPRRAWYRETRAIYTIDLRRFDEAASEIDTAVALADRPYLRYLRGLVACQQGRYAASLSDFDRAIAGQRENAQFYRGRSLALSALGRYAPALADARNLVRLAPQQGESYYALGVALAGLGRDSEAAQALEKAQAIRPELVYTLRARSAVSARLGDEARARADREEADRREADRPHFYVVLDPFRY